MYYAQIDSNNIVVAVSQLSSQINDPNLIPLDSYDIGLLGTVYINGDFYPVNTVEEHNHECDKTTGV